MKSKSLFLCAGLLLAMGIAACSTTKPSNSEKPVESSEEEESSSKRSRSSRSSTEPEPEPVVDLDLFCEENKTWIDQKFDTLYYWNDQNWCGSYCEMRHAELDADGVYHYAWKTDEGSGSCDYSAQFFLNKQDCVPGERYVIMLDIVASDDVSGDDFTLVYALEGTGHPGLKKGMNHVRYTIVQSPRPETETDYFGATVSFHFSAEAAREKEYSIDVSNIRIYAEADAPKEIVIPDLPEGHIHDLEDVAHEKGEGEVAETIKVCKDEPYYEIGFSAIDEAANLAISGDKKTRSVKLSKQNDSWVEYKIYSPVEMKGCFWIDITGNTSNYWDRETKEGQQALFYTYVDTTTGIVDYKNQMDLNGEKVDFDGATYKVGDKDLPFKELVYSDFGTLSSADSASTISVPTPTVTLKAGVNTLKFTRLTGYAFNFHSFTFKGFGAERPAKPALPEWDAAAILAGLSNQSATTATGHFEENGEETFTIYKFGSEGDKLTLTYNSSAAQKVVLELYMSTKNSNTSKCGIWWQLPNGAASDVNNVVQKTEVKLGEDTLAVPEEKSLEYKNLASFNPTKSPDAKDNGSSLSCPVWVSLIELDLAAGENTIVINYLAGGYSYWIGGARLVAPEAPAPEAQTPDQPAA